MSTELDVLSADIAVDLLGWEDGVIGGFGARDMWLVHSEHPPGRGCGTREKDHLFTGNGMLEIIEAMHGVSQRKQNIFVGRLVTLCSKSFLSLSPEIVIRAAHTALQATD